MRTGRKLERADERDEDREEEDEGRTDRKEEWGKGEVHGRSDWWELANQNDE